MNHILEVENLSKSYRLGQLDGRSLILDYKNRFLQSSQSRKVMGRSEPRSGSEYVWSLKDINFTLKRGDALGVIGRNGAGKSTLLKILSRITSPTTGKVRMNGKVASLLEVGTGFHPELSGRDNIYLNGAILGMSRKEISINFDEIVSFAGVEKYIDTPVKRYSSGMYVRLAFAVAAHLSADILIVDEVLAVGDIEFQKKCLSKMQDVTGHGRTILFVSHNMGAIRNLCSSVLVVEKGKDVFQGPTNEGIKKYIGYNDSNITSHAVWSPKNLELAGNEFCKINLVSIKNIEGETTNEIDLSDDFDIEINFTILDSGYKAMFSLVFFDAEGNCVFGSINNLEPNFFGLSMMEGSYQSVCRVPGNLLNDGTYSISLVGMSSSRTEPFTLEHILQVKMQDDGILKRGYDGNYGGVIRPKLDWQTKTHL